MEGISLTPLLLELHINKYDMNKIQQVKIQQVLNVTLLSNKKITTFYLKNSSEVNFNTKNFKLSGRFNHTLKETSMMWPSQNFLLYNGTIIKIKVNERINN